MVQYPDLTTHLHSLRALVDAGEGHEVALVSKINWGGTEVVKFPHLVNSLGLQFF